MSNDLQVKIATCCRMMEWMGFMDLHGHVSARLPDTDYVYINSWGKSRCSLTPEDVIKVNLEGKVFNKGDRAPSETHLHTAIYRMRPDVKAVAHFHSPMAVILSIAGKKIIPVLGYGAIFPLSGVPVYDDSRLADTMERAEAVAKVLGQERAVVLNAHGVVVAEQSVEGVFFASLCLEDNAKKLFSVYQIGQPQVLPSEELEDYLGRYTERVFSKAWSYYRDKAGVSV